MCYWYSFESMHRIFITREIFWRIYHGDNDDEDEGQDENEWIMKHTKNSDLYNSGKSEIANT